MASVSFSATEFLVFGPVIELSNLKTYSIKEFIAAQAGARLLIINTIFTATIDVCVHLVSGTYKAAILVGRVWIFRAASTIDEQEVLLHFQQVAMFAVVTPIYALAAIVWPGVFSYYTPPALGPQRPNPAEDNVSRAPKSVTALVNEVAAKPGKFDLNKHQRFWRSCSLLEKSWYVHLFNQEVKGFDKVRQAMASTVYRPIQQLSSQPSSWMSSFWSSSDKSPQWLAPHEVEKAMKETTNKLAQKLSTTTTKVNALVHAHFFHATKTKHILKNILRTRKVMVMHRGAYRGAFTSTTPEVSGYGNYVLAFRDNIAFHSHLDKGIQNTYSYWSGFSRSILVKPETLSCIIIDNTHQQEMQEIEKECHKRFGQAIPVFRLSDVQEVLNELKRLKGCVPAHWT